MNHEQILLEHYLRLLEISRDLVSTLNIEELLHRIVNAAADLCNAEATSILLYDENRKVLSFEASTNMESPLMRGFSVPVDSSIAGWVVTNRQPVIIGDAQKDNRHYGVVGETVNLRTTSLLAVPLVTKEKVIGALEAINKKNGGFTLEDQDILTALGAQAAIAIENTRLFQQSDLIAELVHELRTPLASLGTAVHLMQRPQIPAEQQGKFITIIQDEIARLSDLTSTFLDLSRLESGRVQFHPELFDLKPVVTNCLEIMQGRIAEKNLELLVEIPNDPLPLKADKDKIKQVILNLLSNATKYNFPGGKIHLTIYRTEAEISLAVQDTGPGISEANLKRLFEKFYRVPGTEKMAQGTGLGLLICKRIIEAHGGRISVQSQVGQGTTFSIHLPLSGNRG